jgi:hypothetical protein
VKAQIVGLPAAHHPSPTGLTVLWLEILELAHAGHDDQVAERLTQLALRPDDLDTLFGPGASGRLWGEYTRAFASFTGAGAKEIAQKIRERRYDDVEVVACPALECDRPAMPTTSPAAQLLPLRCNAQVYSIRLKRAEETDGIRIDTFVYLEGGWRTALKVGRKAGCSSP